MDTTEDIKKKQQQLTDWKNSYNQMTKNLPNVQQSLDIIQYQLQVVSEAPNELPINLKNEIEDSFSKANSYWDTFTTNQDTSMDAISGLAIEASGSNAAQRTLQAATVGYSNKA